MEAVKKHPFSFEKNDKSDFKVSAEQVEATSVFLIADILICNSKKSTGNIIDINDRFVLSQ